MPGERLRVAVDGRELEVSNLDKVLYPEVGFTKGQVIDYYRRVAPVMLPHVADRGVTLRRFPNGTDTPGFFEKRCPDHRPDWVGTAPGPGDREGPIGYCVLDSAAAIVIRRLTRTPMISRLLVNITSGISANGMPNESTTWLITSVRSGSKPIAITTNAGIIVTIRRT